MKLPLTFLDVSQHLTNKILALTGAKSGVYHRAMVPLSVYLIVVEDRVPWAYPCGNEAGDGLMPGLIILIQRTLSTDSNIIWCGCVSTAPDPESEDL
jgi:hypothetical protein